MEKAAPSDAELLADWLGHQREQAFHALVARYAGLVHMAAKRTCGDEVLAAEASQLAFILLARKAKSLASRTSLAGWLHLTAVMQAKNLLRQNRRETQKRQLLKTTMETNAPGQSGDTWKEMQPVIDDALASLSEGDRVALLLRFYRSLSIREIAATIGTTIPTAQKRIDRATERLRVKLARRGVRAGGSLSAAMIGGFAVEAQAAALPVSLLASNAIAAGAISSGAFFTIPTLITATDMKTTSFVLPVAVLILAGTWIGMQRHSIAKLERESALLDRYLAEQPADHVAVVKSVRDKPDFRKRPIRWKDVALHILEMREEGPDAYFKALGDWESRLSAMSEEELTAALDEIEDPDIPAESRKLLEGMFIETLIQKVPEVALFRFSDRLTEKADVLARAWAAWARKDRIAAVLWFDEQVAAGTFHSKSLSGKNQALMKFEGSLLAVLMSSDPEDAVRRVVAIPEDQRGEILGPSKIGRIEDEDQFAYANLVRRSQISESAQIDLLAQRIEELPYGNEYAIATAYMERIQATPAERAVCVERAAYSRIKNLGDNREITRDDLDQLREWTRIHAPEMTDRVTGNSLINALRARNPLEFPEAAALAVEYQEASGNDEVVVRLLEAWNRQDSADEARALAGKIADEKKRAAILERIRVLENLH